MEKPPVFVIQKEIEIRKKAMKARELELQILEEYEQKGDFVNKPSEVLEQNKEYMKIKNEIIVHNSINTSKAEKEKAQKEIKELQKMLRNP